MQQINKIVNRNGDTTLVSAEFTPLLRNFLHAITVKLAIRQLVSRYGYPLQHRRGSLSDEFSAAAVRSGDRVRGSLSD
jgi:hypothetical protein